MIFISGFHRAVCLVWVGQVSLAASLVIGLYRDSSRFAQPNEFGNENVCSQFMVSWDCKGTSERLKATVKILGNGMDTVELTFKCSRGLEAIYVVCWPSMRTI